MAGKWLKWYGHIKRTEEGRILRRMLDAPMLGKRWRGRQKTRWKDSCKRDIGRMVLRLRIYWTGQRGREIFIMITIPPIADDGKSMKRRHNFLILNSTLIVFVEFSLQVSCLSLHANHRNKYFYERPRIRSGTIRELYCLYV